MARNKNTEKESEKIRNRLLQTKPPSKKKADFDIWFLRLANLSQIGLLALAIFGYIYTVIPVYEKSLLDEDIAKKTLELEKKDSLLDAKNAELSSLTTSVAEMKENLRKSQQELSNYHAEIASYNRKIVDLSSGLSHQYSELRVRLIDEFQQIAFHKCYVGSLGNTPFSKCLIEQALPNAALQPLSNEDKGKLLSTLNLMSAKIDSDWASKKSELDKQDADFQSKVDDQKTTCAKFHSSDFYKNPPKTSEDRDKKLDLDMKCFNEAINLPNQEVNRKNARIDALMKYTRDSIYSIALAFFK